MNFSLLTISLISGLFAGIGGCTLPLYPVMFNHMTRSKENPKIIALMFSLGLAGVYFVMYMIFGLILAFMGSELIESIEIWRGRLLLVGAVIAFIMAYRTLKGTVRGKTIKLFNIEDKGGYLGALASGFGYGAIVTPCNAGFLLTGILPALASKVNALEGMILLLLFTLAFAMPMLLLGLAAGTAMTTMKFIQENMSKLKKLSVIFLIWAGLYFIYLFTFTI